MIFGEYAVAEKYINTLKQTIYYNHWATTYSNYQHDTSLMTNNELYQKRKSLIGEGIYAVNSSIVKTLQQLGDNNPKNSLPFQYLTAFHLLGKNLSIFNDLHDRYYRTDVWQSLNKTEQEAIIALNHDDPRSWPQKGVTLKTEKRYSYFIQDMRDKRNQFNYQEFMKQNYGDTYWYYLMFTSTN